MPRAGASGPAFLCRATGELQCCLGGREQRERCIWMGRVAGGGQAGGEGTRSNQQVLASVKTAGLTASPIQ